MTVQEQNKMIAEFEQRKFYGRYTIDNYGPGTSNAYPEMKYHTDWNWLMPIVEKIGNTRVKSAASYNSDLMFKVEITNGYTQILGTGRAIFYNCSIEGSMLMATYKSVVEFIEWHNSYLATLTKQNQEK